MVLAGESRSPGGWVATQFVRPSRVRFISDPRSAVRLWRHSVCYRSRQTPACQSANQNNVSFLAFLVSASRFWMISTDHDSVISFDTTARCNSSTETNVPLRDVPRRS